VRVLSNPPVPEVLSAQVDDSAFLLDVREDDEWSAGHVPHAVHVPLGQLTARLAEVPKDREVVVVCRSGMRSARAVGFLQSQGWDRVVNLGGGMQAWQAAGRPMVSEDGLPARVV
jgi:rhodanese-related sulfurtransferase